MYVTVCASFLPSPFSLPCAAAGPAPPCWTQPIPLRWTELRDFAFSDTGFSNRYSDITGEDTGAAAAAAANGSSSGGSSGAAAAAAAGAGAGDGADGLELGAGAGVKAGGGRGGQETPKRWDHPFHHTVPPFPMPRKRPAPWAEAEAVEGAGAAGGEWEVRRVVLDLSMVYGE